MEDAAKMLSTARDGIPLLDEVTTAIVHDSEGVSILLKDMRLCYQSVSLVKADKGYCGVDSGITNAICRRHGQ